MKTLITLLIIATLAPALLAADRDWTNLSGTRITAELASVDGDEAVLNVQGKDYRVPIAKLSADDRAFIAKWQEEQSATTAATSDGKATAPASELLAAMKGNLVALDGREMVPYEIGSPEKIQVLAFYSSASWCGPCQAFSPTLGKEYKSLKRKYDNFELVLLSSDNAAEDWKGYVIDHKMPFPSLDFEKNSVKGKLSSGNKSGFIPSILIKTVDGEVLDDGKAGAEKSLEHLEDILKDMAKGS